MLYKADIIGVKLKDILWGGRPAKIHIQHYKSGFVEANPDLSLKSVKKTNSAEAINVLLPNLFYFLIL